MVVILEKEEGVSRYLKILKDIVINHKIDTIFSLYWLIYTIYKSKRLIIN